MKAQENSPITRTFSLAKCHTFKFILSIYREKLRVSVSPTAVKQRNYIYNRTTETVAWRSWIRNDSHMWTAFSVVMSVLLRNTCGWNDNSILTIYVYIRLLQALLIAPILIQSAYTHLRTTKNVMIPISFIRAYRHASSRLCTPSSASRPNVHIKYSADKSTS